MRRSPAYRGGIRLNLAVKLALAVVASFAALFSLFGYLAVSEHKRHSEELVLQSADRITDLILRSTRYQMLHNDRAALYEMIRNMGAERGIRRVRIFNEEGRISFSTERSEIGKVVDKRAEACYRCHSSDQPIAGLSRPDRARVFRTPEGERVLAMIRPIENEPGCWSTACHFHPPERRVLGVIDAHLSLAEADAQLASFRRHVLGLVLLSMVAATMVSVGFIMRVIHRPVRELMGGIQKVASGDLNHRLRVCCRDELGELAEAFNRMTEDLAKAREEILAWNRTLEQRVQQKTQELEQAYASLVVNQKLASLGKLAATVAHEVNNPLFGILTYARLVLKDLQREDLPPDLRARMLQRLEIIERESKRCGELMKNLLTYARQTPPRKQLEDLNDLVRRALSLVRHQAELQGVEIAENLRSSLPPCFCDGGQIQQVLVALLANALEAQPHGGRIEVCTELAEDGACARVRVRDYGPGIPPEILPHIFEPFFTTKEDRHRTGMGLAIATNIAEHHGGSLEVNSAPGAGAEFILTLPLQSRVAAINSASGGQEQP